LPECTNLRKGSFINEQEPSLVDRISGLDVSKKPEGVKPRWQRKRDARIRKEAIIAIGTTAAMEH
jgi:hypothetical protein